MEEKAAALGKVENPDNDGAVLQKSGTLRSLSKGVPKHGRRELYDYRQCYCALLSTGGVIDTVLQQGKDFCYPCFFA